MEPARRPLDRRRRRHQPVHGRADRAAVPDRSARVGEDRAAEVVHRVDAAARGGVDRRVPRASTSSCSSSPSSSCSSRCTSSSPAGATTTAATRRRSSSCTRWPARRSCSSASSRSRSCTAAPGIRSRSTSQVLTAWASSSGATLDGRRPSGCSSAFAIALRGQGAAVPVPHVAARRAHRGADRRLGRPGRRAAEDGHVRVPALRGPDVPAGRGRPRADPARRRGDRHHLRSDRRRDATRPETARSRTRRSRTSASSCSAPSRSRTQGIQGGLFTMSQPRAHDRRAVPPRRHALRPPPHVRDRRLRRPVEGRSRSSAACSSPRRSRRSGCPASPGFVGEFLALLGAFLTHRWYAVVATTGVILAAIYLLWAVQRAFTGEPEGENVGHARHLAPRARDGRAAARRSRSSSASTRSRCSTACSRRVDDLVAPRRGRQRLQARRRVATKARPSPRSRQVICSSPQARRPTRSRRRRSTGSRSRRSSRCSRPRSLIVLVRALVRSAPRVFEAVAGASRAVGIATSGVFTVRAVARRRPTTVRTRRSRAWSPSTASRCSSTTVVLIAHAARAVLLGRLPRTRTARRARVPRADAAARPPA